MAQRSLRFGIGDGADGRATTWKLWTETGHGESDVYLACRALGGSLKASLHQSGSWHVAYSRQAFEDKVQGVVSNAKDRFIEQWPKPAQIGRGITLAFRIVTPWSAVVASAPEAKNRDIIWLPNAPEGKATEIDILFAGPTASIDRWPGSRSMGTSLIGSFCLGNGDTVWAVYWVVDMPDLSGIQTGAWRFFRGASKEDPHTGQLRALVLGSELDGSRVMYDCAVRRPVPS